MNVCAVQGPFHTDASDQIARQNTVTSFLTFITDSVYRFMVFIDSAMLLRRISHLLDLRMLKRQARSQKGPGGVAPGTIFTPPS